MAGSVGTTSPKTRRRNYSVDTRRSPWSRCARRPSACRRYGHAANVRCVGTYPRRPPARLPTARTLPCPAIGFASERADLTRLSSDRGGLAASRQQQTSQRRSGRGAQPRRRSRPAAPDRVSRSECHGGGPRTAALRPRPSGSRDVERPENHTGARLHHQSHVRSVAASKPARTQVGPAHCLGRPPRAGTRGKTAYRAGVNVGRADRAER
jgi:hypothetical protein